LSIPKVEKDYIHAEFASDLFGFVDDVQFVFPGMNRSYMFDRLPGQAIMTSALLAAVSGTCAVP
jgi:hypothetical protein